MQNGSPLDLISHQPNQMLQCAILRGGSSISANWIGDWLLIVMFSYASPFYCFELGKTSLFSTFFRVFFLCILLGHVLLFSLTFLLNGVLIPNYVTKGTSMYP